MKKTYIAAVSFVSALLLIGLSAVFLGSFHPNSNPSPNPSTTLTPTLTQTPKPSATAMETASPTPNPTSTDTTYTYQIINTYPHDTAAFTEGLVYDNGSLFESTGGLGTSYLRRVDLQSGNVLQQYQLPSQFFGEGLAAVNGSLVQLTWLNYIGFVYEEGTFSLQGNFSYGREGWGLAYDGSSRLIASDGSSNLYFLDPTTYQTVGRVTVKDGNTPVTNLNELEYVNGDVYANVWLQQKIAIINPQTGQVKNWIDLTGIYQSNNPDAVLNGIAYDQQTGNLYITGKDWPNLYQIKIVPIN